VVGADHVGAVELLPPGLAVALAGEVHQRVDARAQVPIRVEVGDVEWRDAAGIVGPHVGALHEPAVAEQLR